MPSETNETDHFTCEGCGVEVYYFGITFRNPDFCAECQWLDQTFRHKPAEFTRLYDWLHRGDYNAPNSNRPRNRHPRNNPPRDR